MVHTFSGPMRVQLSGSHFYREPCDCYKRIGGKRLRASGFWHCSRLRLPAWGRYISDHQRNRTPVRQFDASHRKSMQKSKFGCWLAGSHSVTRILTGWENPNGIMDQRNLLHGWQILRQILISGCFFIHTHTTREKGSGCCCLAARRCMQRSAVSNEKAAAATSTALCARLRP
eukprot:COSAG01_NODE_963_length_12407_cov_38.330598_16_plen_173_part_00